MLLMPSHQVLIRAERLVALLGRCRPRNAQSEAVRLERAWMRGDRIAPRWSYEPAPDLSDLRRVLCAMEHQWRGSPEVRALFTERVRELVLESHVVEAIGRRKTFARLARSRFEPAPRWLAQADVLAHEWLSAVPEPTVSRFSLSDDESDHESLVSCMRARVGAEKLPFRVEVSEHLMTAAATGERTIIVGVARPLTSSATQRIVEHEVSGHAWPRIKAQRQRVGLFASASRKGNDIQEGFALHCELQAGLLDGHRRRELGWRHLAAKTVWQGASWVETTDALLQWGADLAPALQIASRVHRAGGLAREIVYLPAFCSVSAAIAADPSVALWLGAGRLSLEAIDVLRALSLPLVP